MIDEQQRAHHIGQVASRFLSEVEERVEATGGAGVDLLGLPTGFTVVDAWTGGLRPDTVTIVGGTTSTGKTSFAISVLLEAARAEPKKTALFFSLEMRAEVLVNRLFSQMTDIPTGRIVRGKLTDDEFRRVCDAADELSAYNVHIVDRTATSEKIKDYAMELGDKQPLSLIVVDYLGLLQDTKGESETVRVGNISRNFRTMVRPDNLNIPLVLLAQLSRAAHSSEDGRPKLHHFRDSSNIEQDAENAILLHRPSKMVQDAFSGGEPQAIENDAEIIIAKNREGIIGITEAQFYPRTVQWKQ